jgi:site-specific DNA recombinase
LDKYFGYIRVSTAKQGERSVSLPEQKDAIDRYAKRSNLVIADWFEERQTAAKKGRPVWAQMLKALRLGKAKGVVIHKIDRSARNLKDWADLGELIDQGIEVHFANESLDLHSRGGRLSADIQAVVAADYIRNLREEAKKGIYGRLKQGFYPLRAPLGYQDNGAGKAKTIDPVTGPLVRKAFELYVTGNFTLYTLRDELFRLGLRNRGGGKVSMNGLSKILNNSFYMGIITIKRNGQVFQGNHESLISKHIFDTVQDVLQGRFHTRTNRHEFLFRRLVACQECGSTLIGEQQKGRAYFRCHTRTCSTTGIREDVIENAVTERLRALEFTEAEKQYLASAIRELKARWIADREQSLKNLEARRERLTERLTRLTDAYLDGTIEKDLFDERKAAILFDRQAIQGSITSLQAHGTSIPDLIQGFLERAGSLYSSYQRASTEQKRRIMKTVTSNLALRQKSIEFAFTRPFREIAEREKDVYCSPNRGVHRTWEPILTQLLALFEKDPGLDFAPITN